MLNQKIAIAMPIEENLMEPLYYWGKRFDWSHINEVHFLHIVKKNVTPLEFGLVEMPDEKTFNEMLPTLTKFIQDEAKKILPSGFKGTVKVEIKKDFNPADEMIQLLKEHKINLVVVSTRGKHGFEGLFHSSFTDHLVKFAPCDLYVVRPSH